MELELLKTGGPFLIAVVLIFKMYLEGKPTPVHTFYDREIKRLDKTIATVDSRWSKTNETFTLTLQQFASCVSKLSSKLDLHAQTLENINGNLEKISDRLTHLERRG